MGNALYRNDELVIAGDPESVIACGFAHSFVVKVDGTLWATGLNNYGQLGLGDSSRRTVFEQVGTLTMWKRIACGNYHTLAIMPDGTLWSTGYNGDGALGVGDNSNKNVFTQVGVLTTWEYIACGSGQSLAIKSDGTLWSAGYNGYGQLGLGDASARNVFTQVGSSLWKKIVGGGSYSLAIRSDDTLWSTGYNYYGELGLGNNGSGTNRGTFTQVGTTTWQSIAAGYDHTLAIKMDGSLWGTGRNGNGQLGLNDTANRNTLTQVGALTTWEKIFCGGYHTIALKADGTLWSVGWSGYGQLGLGNYDQKTEFTQIGVLTTWINIMCGFYHSLTLQSDGEVWGTGANLDGQFGLNDTTNRNVFTDMNIDAGVGGASTLAVIRRRNLWERTAVGKRRVRSFYELHDRVAIVGEEWSPFISVGTSRQLGNMCATSDGRAIISYILSDICYVAFAENLSLVLGGTVGFGSGTVIKTGVLGKGSGQPAGVAVNNIDNQLYMVIYYYDSVADTFKAEFWLDSTGLGDSFIFVSFISELLMGAGIALFYGPAIISYIIKSSGGNLIVLLPYMSSYYTMAYYTIRAYYSSDGGLSWTLGGAMSYSYTNTYLGGNLLELPDGLIITCGYQGGIFAWNNSGTSFLGASGWINFPDTGHMFAPGFVITSTGDMFLLCYNGLFRYNGLIPATLQTIRDGYNWTSIYDGPQISGAVTFRGLLCGNIILIQDVQNSPSHLYGGSYLSTMQTILHRVNLG